MATLLDFPQSAPRGHVPNLTVLKGGRTGPARETTQPLPATGGRRGEYALADIARPLGLLHKSIRTIIDALRVLAKHDGMPLPRTPRIVSGKPVKGPNSICKDSRWDAGEIDAWLEGRGPVSPAPALLPPAIRKEMQLRAIALGGGR